MPRTTCTASAAPRAWARKATRSASPASAMHVAARHRGLHRAEDPGGAGRPRRCCCPCRRVARRAPKAKPGEESVIEDALAAATAERKRRRERDGGGRGRETGWPQRRRRVAVAAARHATAGRAVKAGRVARSRALRHRRRPRRIGRGSRGGGRRRGRATQASSPPAQARAPRACRPRSRSAAPRRRAPSPRAVATPPKLRTRLKQKVKSFLAVFRGGRH
jgi:hypothetical protein